MGAGSAKDGDLLWSGGSLEQGPYYLKAINNAGAPIGFVVTTK